MNSTFRSVLYNCFVLAVLMIWVPSGKAGLIKITISTRVAEVTNYPGFQTELDNAFGVGDVINLHGVFDTSSYKREFVVSGPGSSYLSAGGFLDSISISSSTGVRIDGVGGGLLEILGGYFPLSEKRFETTFSTRNNVPTNFVSPTGLFDNSIVFEGVRFGGSYDFDRSNPLTLFDLIDLPVESLFSRDQIDPQPAYMNLGFYDFYQIFGPRREVKSEVYGYSFKAVPDIGYDTLFLSLVGLMALRRFRLSSENRIES